MDSPNASGYVPLSLVDTLTKPRTYRSSQTTNPGALTTPSTLTSSRSYHHAHSASLSALAAKERSEQARREAAAISQTLGLGVVETPVGPTRRTFNALQSSRRPEEEEDSIDSTPRPQSHSSPELVTALRVQLGDKDEEIASLRRELGSVQKDKRELAIKLDQQEQRLARGNGSVSGGLDATQVEELVKQFNDQEALLGGYQREAEKSLAELDRLRNKERRFNDWFERMYGPGWAEELNLTGKPSLSSSPAIRTKLTSRPTLLPAPPCSSSSPASTSSATVSPSSIFASSETTTSSQGPVDVSTSTPPSDVQSSCSATSLPPPRPHDPNLSANALKQHLESVQALIRGMETRLISRGVELEAVEKRARSEARLAESKRLELERLMAVPSGSSSPAPSLTA